MIAESRSVRMAVETLREELVETRQLLHRTPELGFQEVETSALVAGPPAVVNDPAMCEVVRTAALAAVAQEQVFEPAPVMAGDDVALFLNQAPGCMFLVGSADPSRGLDAPHHHPRFDFAEEALGTAAAVFAGAALRYLS